MSGTKELRTMSKDTMATSATARTQPLTATMRGVNDE